MKVSVCLQITVDGEVVTDPDMTLGYFSLSKLIIVTFFPISNCIRLFPLVLYLLFQRSS